MTRARATRRRSSCSSPRTTSAMPATCCAKSGTKRTASTAMSRGRSTPIWRTTATRRSPKRATKQRCLWASTSTKNPEYRDVLYVEELIGPETVNTMPEETIKAFQDHGRVAETLTRDVEGARRLFLDLRAAGIDYDDVTDTLEREGVQKFSDSFAELLDGVRAKRGELVSA